LCDLDRDLCAHRTRPSEQKAETQGEFLHGITVDGGGQVARQNRKRPNDVGAGQISSLTGSLLFNTMLKVGC